MCRRITCKDCGRPTFAGCGMHVEQVLGDVPPAERCRCRDKAGRDDARAATSDRARPSGWLEKLFAK